MKKDILILNENSNIAISTLWTNKEYILNILPENIRNKIGIIGTTYTSYGVNYILETLSKYNKINKLILFGADLSTSGDTLMKLFNNKEIPNIISLNRDIVKNIIKDIDIIDLRQEYWEKDFEYLKKVIEENYQENRNPTRNIYELKVEEKEDLQSWPYPLSGHYIYEVSVFRAWIKILDLIMKFGSIKYSEYEEPQKEFLNIMVTIGLYGKEYQIEKEFFEFIDKKEFDKHIYGLMRASKPFGVDYTYGERFLSHRIGKNQIEYLINKLKDVPYSRRALVISWDHEIDINSKNPPCIIGVQGIITDDYYNHTVWIRSNDMVKGWPLNIVGQIELAKKIVEEINNRAGTDFKIGTITTISTSAHIYKHDWDIVRNILSKYSYKMMEFVPDPRGNFLIYEDGDKITIEHRTPDHFYVDFKLSTKNFWEIYNKLKGGSYFSLADHAMYIGKELKSAFDKFSRGEKYIQDQS